MIYREIRQKILGRDSERKTDRYREKYRKIENERQISTKWYLERVKSVGRDRKRDSEK